MTVHTPDVLGYYNPGEQVRLPDLGLVEVIGNYARSTGVVVVLVMSTGARIERDGYSPVC